MSSDGLQFDRHFEGRIGLGAIDNPRVPGGGLGILVAQHVLYGTQVARVAVGQRGAGVAQRVV